MASNAFFLFSYFIFLSVRNNKTRSMAGHIKVRAFDSPRDTAMRSVPELKQFVAHFAMIF
ncbi:hypothetical protein DFX78_21225 [Escherichia coli]|nr:hypothetical protein [Escherichia coli]